MLITLSEKFDGQPVEAMLVVRSAFELAEHNKSLVQKARCYEYESWIKRDLGDYPSAIDASLKALRIYDRLNRSDKTAAMQLQIGSHFSAEKNYSKATQYISQALKSLREEKDTSNIILALINLGETYRTKGNLDSAEVLFKECLEMNQLQKNDYAEVVNAYAKGNLGMVYASQKKDQEAIKLLKSSINTLGEMEDYYSSTVYQAELAQIYIRQGKKQQGEELLREALGIAEREKLKEQIRDISKDLSQYYEQNNRLRQALELRKQYEVYHDSLVNVENVRKTEQLESQYQLDKRDANIQLLELENRNKRNTVIGLSIGSFILLVMLFFVYRLQMLRKRAYQKVSEQKDIIEKREKEKALLLKELNHRVKNNLQMVSSMFSLQAGQLRGTPAEEALTAGRRRIDALMLIHQKLYRENVDTEIPLPGYIKELTESLIYSFDKKTDLNFDAVSVALPIDKAIPLGIVINELVTNALKYGPDEGMTLELSVQQDEENIFVTIADNGPGVPDGFDIQKSSSLGLKLVHSLIRQLHGEVIQTNDNGCRWEIVLKKAHL
ncbi:MAG: tetratricopeptide repeat-containing sensor histidine kinase [Marinilabiliaceae bacterium]